jgi:methyl-accepting chemotaxis protein
MRIGQTFVVVLCIVLSLIIVGGIVLVRSSDARSLAQQGEALNAGSGDLEKAATSFDAAVVTETGGDIGAARAATDAGLQWLVKAEAEFKRFESPAASELARKTAALAASVNGIASASQASEAHGLAVEADSSADGVLARAVEEGKGLVRFGIIAYIIILIITVIAGMVTMIVAYKGLSGIVKKVIDEVRDIAKGKGDLKATVSVPTKDVMGDLADAINEMVSSLRDSMIDMQTIAVELANSADSLAGSIEGMSSSIEEVTAAAEQISTGSEDQARKVEDTSHAMAEVSRTIEGISDKGQVSAR